MSGRLRNWLAISALVPGLAGASACATGTVLGDTPPATRTSVVEGQVRSVDTRSGRLEVRDRQRQRNQTVRMDRQTVVVYRQQRYPVTSLERGDLVRVRVSYDRSGTAWADRVDVRESARQRDAWGARTYRLDGTVAGVDHRRRHFIVQQNRRQNVVVQVPNRLSRNDARRFDRLRRGDRVRVEVREAGRRVELIRFR